MDFNFENNNEPEKPEGQNDFSFSFNPENNGADTDNSVANESSPFDWTPDQTTDSEESDQVEIFDDVLTNVDNAEDAPVVPDIPDSNQEETPDAADEVANDLFGSSVQEPAEEQFDEPVEPAASEEDVFEEQPEDVNVENDVEEPEETTPSDDAQDVEAASDEESTTPEEGILIAVPEEAAPAPAPAALDKRVRTPDGEQEYLLSELIDVETGEPLDLTSLIPEELLTAAAPEATEGFSMGAAQPASGGFDMSAGAESAPSKRRRPARPKAQKKGGSIVGIVFGGLLAFVLFPYVMALIEMTTGAQSNIPIPAPGIKSTYKYIPEWWPEWAMFVFPGRNVEATDNPADAPAQPKADEPAVPADNAAPADDAAAADEEAASDDAVPSDEEAPADAAAADDGSAVDDAVAADDGAFDPDAFLGNEVAEDNNAQPEDAPADDVAPADDAVVADEAAPAADEAVEPGVVNAPQYTSADVTEAVANVRTTFKAAKAIDDSVYAALSNMAEKSTFVDANAADDQLKDVLGKVKTVMGNLGTKASLATAISEKWAARAGDDSDNAGVMLVGKLTDVSERDGYSVNTITIEGQDGAVEVVGLNKIEPVVGDKVVVCGKRIANPDKNLGGFTDNGKPVIWGGIVIKAEEK